MTEFEETLLEYQSRMHAIMDDMCLVVEKKGYTPDVCEKFQRKADDLIEEILHING